jgi:hypothetical protein
MPALKTNVLVCCVVQDDSGQLAAAKRLIERCVGDGDGQSLFVPMTVTLELEWVLRANFGYVKDEGLLVLSNLFAAAELAFESERALEPWKSRCICTARVRPTSPTACTSHWPPRPANSRSGHSTRVPPRSPELS